MSLPNRDFIYSSYSRVSSIVRPRYLILLTWSIFLFSRLIYKFSFSSCNLFCCYFNSKTFIMSQQFKIAIRPLTALSWSPKHNPTPYAPVTKFIHTMWSTKLIAPLAQMDGYKDIWDCIFGLQDGSHYNSLRRWQTMLIVLADYRNNTKKIWIVLWHSEKILKQKKMQY